MVDRNIVPAGMAMTAQHCADVGCSAVLLCCAVQCCAPGEVEKAGATCEPGPTRWYTDRARVYLAQAALLV